MSFLFQNDQKILFYIKLKNCFKKNRSFDLAQLLTYFLEFYLLDSLVIGINHQIFCYCPQFAVPWQIEFINYEWISSSVSCRKRPTYTIHYSAGCVNNIFLRGCECVSVTWVGMKATRAPAKEVLLTFSWRAMAVFPWRVGGLLLILATLLPPTDAQLGDWETTSLCVHDSSCQLTSIYCAMIFQFCLSAC